MIDPDKIADRLFNESRPATNKSEPQWLWWITVALMVTLPIWIIYLGMTS